MFANRTKPQYRAGPREEARKVIKGPKYNFPDGSSRQDVLYDSHAKGSQRGNPYHDAKGLFTSAAGAGDKGQQAFKSMIKEGMAADKSEPTKFQKFMRKKRAELAQQRRTTDLSG